MVRSPRLQFEGAFYHVYSRGNRRGRIFYSKDDYREFEEFLLDLACRLNVHLYKWSLMPNHFHLLIETPDGNLAVFMQRLIGAYARYFNRTHKQTGHVFQGRYGARLCDKEAYLLELVRYIALNAYRAKNYQTLVQNGEAEWGSHRYYLHGDEPLTVRPYIHDVLRRFSDDLENARSLYAAFVAEGLSDPGRVLVLPMAKRYLGSERFIEESKQKAQHPIRQHVRLKPCSLDKLVRVVWEQLHITEEELLSDSQERRLTTARKAFVLIAKKSGHSTAALAQRLRKEPTAVSHMFRALENQPDNPWVQTLRSALEAGEAWG